jgi:hypothetical protein
MGNNGREHLRPEKRLCGSLIGRSGEEQAVARLRLPEGAADEGWEMDKGVPGPGMETLVMLARETKLPTEGEQKLKGALAAIGTQPLQDGN